MFGGSVSCFQLCRTPVALPEEPSSWKHTSAPVAGTNSASIKIHSLGVLLSLLCLCSGGGSCDYIGCLVPVWMLVVLGWTSTKLSSVGGGLWKKVRVPSPFCTWRAARPDRPLSDTARDGLQLDPLQNGRTGREPDGGEVSGSYKRTGKRCRYNEVQ